MIALFTRCFILAEVLYVFVRLRFVSFDFDYSRTYFFAFNNFVLDTIETSINFVYEGDT